MYKFCLYIQRIFPEGFMRDWKHWNEGGKHCDWVWKGVGVRFSLYTLSYFKNFIPCNVIYLKHFYWKIFLKFFLTLLSPSYRPISLQNYTKALSLFAVSTSSSPFFLQPIQTLFLSPPFYWKCLVQVIIFSILPNPMPYFYLHLHLSAVFNTGWLLPPWSNFFLCL